MNTQNNQKESFAKLIRDLLLNKVATVIKTIAPTIGMAFLTMNYN